MRDESIMIDIETLSCNSNAVIVSIGAVVFNMKTGNLGAQFYCNVCSESCKKVGLHEDQDTIKWWAKQSQEARDALKENKLFIQDAVHIFREWILKHTEKDSYIWANGPEFDCIILSSAFKAVHEIFPIPYWRWKSYSTFLTTSKLVKNIFGSKEKLRVLKRTGTFHNALDDAKHQALTLLEVTRGLREEATK